MINATLGGLIKDYRLQKGISQLEIAFALGWKETSRLSRIEQGVTEKPSRETIDKIISTLILKDEEKNSVLLAGGYLPTEIEIEQIRNETQNFLINWKYPAILMDFSWRVIDQNPHNVHLYQQKRSMVDYIYKNHTRILEVVFNPEIMKLYVKDKQFAKQWYHLFYIAILTFKYDQRYHTKERWYIDHIKRLMTIDEFRNIWKETENKDAYNGIVGNTGIKIISCPEDARQNLAFNFFIMPILKDTRFQTELFVPADSFTASYYDKRNQSLAGR